MYPNPSATAGQWTPNGPSPPQPQPPPPPPHSSHHNNGPPLQHWQHQQPIPQQPNGQYLQRPSNQIPPISQALPQGPPPNMTTLQPQHPDQYRSLPPPPPMYGHPPYHQQPPMPYAPQPAPRQRTAIACRYCRRRKIRCSGFDQSEDGRCTNCQRFTQECVFTPVSAQTQAFVPAHTVWRNQGQPPQQLYGAYGQPLPQQHAQYPPQQQQQQQQQHQHQHPHQQQQQPHPYPNQPGPYPGPQMYPMPPNGPPQGVPPNAAPQQLANPQPQEVVTSRKRPTDEPHTPTLPPPNPATASQMPQHHRTSGGEQAHYTYPDPSVLTPAAASPASSTTSYHSAQPATQPYYASQPPPRRPSPQSYNYDASRSSASPHNMATPGAPSSRPPPQQQATSNPKSQAQQAQAGAGRTSPSNGQTPGGRGVRINELVGPSGQQQQQQQNQSQQTQAQLDEGRARSAADSDMLTKLNNRM